jgi:hypothetical protein
MRSVHAKGNRVGGRRTTMSSSDATIQEEADPHRATVQMYGTETGLIASDASGCDVSTSVHERQQGNSLYSDCLTVGQDPGEFILFGRLRAGRTTVIAESSNT